MRKLDDFQCHRCRVGAIVASSLRKSTRNSICTGLLWTNAFHGGRTVDAAQRGRFHVPGVRSFIRFQQPLQLWMTSVPVRARSVMRFTSRSITDHARNERTCGADFEVFSKVLRRICRRSMCPGRSDAIKSCVLEPGDFFRHASGIPCISITTKNPLSCLTIHMHDPSCSQRPWKQAQKDLLGMVLDRMTTVCCRTA